MRRDTTRFASRAARAFAALALGCAGGTVLGCSPNREPSAFFDPSDVGTLVVDAMLVVGKPLPTVRLTRALSPAVEYTPEAAGETGATVQVQELGTGTVFRYLEAVTPGRYVPLANDPIRQGTAYVLSVVTSAGEVVRARTTTPDTFRVDRWLLLDNAGQNEIRQLQTFVSRGDSVYHAPENQVVYANGLLEARFTRPDVEAFQIGVFSLDPDSDFVIEPEFFDPEDFESIDREESSPALEALDGRLRLPWFTIFFEGRYKIRILALDRNAADWVRSNPGDNSGFGFGNTLGDGFERPIFHVEGGIGLFGSASADSIGFFVHPRPSP